MIFLLLIIEICVIYVHAILGGCDISIRDAPYQANYGDICGAVLIHRKWALTAAHCGREETYIRVGSRYRLRGPKVKIKYHIIHPQYGRKHSFDYDIQLLGLFRELHFSQTVNDIQMSEGECGDNIYVSGWGYLKEKGDYNEILQRVKLQVVPLNKCQFVEQFWYNHTLTASMFCAGGDEGDACQGDSGGAAVSFGRLVGLSSFGFGCGRRIPGVYTNVTHHNISKWIQYYTGHF